MKNVCRIALCSICLLSLTLNAHTATSGDHILFIGSYSISYPASSKQISGLRTALEILPAYSLDLEYMDCKRFPGDTVNIRLFRDRIAYKLKTSDPFSVVMAADDDAFNFALSEQNGLFKGIPIVFLGVNNVRKALAQNANPQVTGVIEQVSFKENVDLMIKLFPKSDDIYVITDGVRTGAILLNEFKIFWSKAHYHKTLRIIDASSMTFSQLAQELRKIPSYSPSLLFSLYKDKTGKTISFDEGVHFVSRNTKSPIFHFWSLGIGEGLFGGNVVSLIGQGKEAGNLAVAILGGKTPGELKIKEKSPNRYSFDNNQLSRFHISRKDIPADSEIVNLPQSFYEKNKTLVWLFSSIFLIMGIILYVLIIGRMKMKISLKGLAIEKNRALEADKQKSAFLASMSHEIRTPLNAIVGFSELLQNTDDKAMRDNFIKIINQNNDSLLSLVNDILDLSKIESGMVIFNDETFDMTECCQTLYDATVFRASSNPNVIVKESVPFKSCIVSLDKARLEQIWNKYIENSIKYTDSGSITIGYECVNGGIRIFSKDTGIGIPEEKQNLIFKRFEKVDMFSKGTGLGLAICKAIVMRFDGTVGFESTAGKGSTFWAWIPCKTGISE